MHLRTALPLALILLAVCTSCTHRPIASPAGVESEPLVILVGLDGFRWDAMERGNTPNMDRLVKDGFRGALKPVLPSLSFPNLYAVVTGLYPGKNGILANEMYDPELDAYFSSRVFDEGRWWGGEPIWVTVEKQGLVAATTGWVGSSAEIGGVRPTHFVPYVHEKPPAEWVDDLLHQLDEPDRRPVFLTLYHDDVDNHAHDFGVGSPEERAAIERMDTMIGRLIAGLEQRNLFENATIVVVADHGMVNLEPDPVIYLDDFIAVDAVREEALGLGPIAHIWPLDGNIEMLYDSLSGAHPHMTVSRREDIPEQFHFGDHRRTPPILVVAEKGWILSTRSAQSQRRPQTEAGQAVRTELAGMHGYDNELRSMHAIFLAHGPAIRTGVPTQTINMVDVYNLMIHTLGLKPAPNDGEWLHICPILVNPPAECS